MSELLEDSVSIISFIIHDKDFKKLRQDPLMEDIYSCAMRLTDNRIEIIVEVTSKVAMLLKLKYQVA